MIAIRVTTLPQLVLIATTLAASGSAQQAVNTDVGLGAASVAVGAVDAPRCGVAWNWAYPLPQGNQLRAAAFSPDRGHVAVGDRGAVVTSPDGVSWTWRPSGIEIDLYGVAWGAGQFVAVGTEYESISHAVMYSSADGVTWVRRYTDPTYGDANGVTWNGGAFLVVGGAGSYWSTDGIVWSRKGTVDAQFTPKLTAFESGLFVVVGAARNFRRGGWCAASYVSADGSTWTRSLFDTVWQLNGVASDGRRLILVGTDGAIVTSADGGTTWVPRASGTSADLLSVAWTGSRFVALAAPPNAAFVSSLDGIAWTVEPLSVGIPVTTLTRQGDRLLALGVQGSIATSRDAESWLVSAGAGRPVMLNSVTWTGSQFVAVGAPGAVLTSQDGRDWTTRTSGIYSSGSGVTSANGLLVMVSLYGERVATSPDGVRWTPQAAPADVILRGVASDGTRFVAVGERRPPTGEVLGVIITSSDGGSWQEVDAQGTHGLTAVAWTGSQFVAAGILVELLTSPDGLVWTHRTRGRAFDHCSSAYWGGIASNGSRTVVVGAIFEEYSSGGALLVSDDLDNWTCTAPGTLGLFGVAWDGSQFVAGGAAGWVSASGDGLTWTLLKTPASYDLQAVVAACDSLIAVGGAAILESRCAPVPRLRRHITGR